MLPQFSAVYSGVKEHSQQGIELSWCPVWKMGSQMPEGPINLGVVLGNY